MADVSSPAVDLDPDALGALEEQRAFLRRSLTDLRREHEAGDLDEDDYAALQDGYVHRLAAVEAAIADGKAVLATRRPDRNRGRTIGIAAAVLVFALGSGFGVAQLAGRRPAGATITGDTLLTARQRLAKCLSNGFQGDAAKTIACYDDVIARDPTNVEAKTYRAGFALMMQNDLSRLSDLITVAQANPSYPDVHAFLAVAFDRLGRPDSALAELRKLDSLRPPPLMLDLVSELRAQLEATTSTTTTTIAATPTTTTTP